MEKQPYISIEEPNDVSVASDAIVDEISRRLMEQDLEAYKELAK